MIDARSLTLLSFLIVFVVIAAIISTGLIPKIFQTSVDVNQTNSILQHRIELTEQQKHEDQARFNQTQHEDMARDKQVVNITSHIDRQLDKLQFNLLKFIRESENKSNISMNERSEILKKLNIALDNQQSQLSFQDTQLKLLQGQQESIDNVTKDTHDMLELYGDNSIRMFQKIIDTQQEILKELNSTG